MKASKDFLKKIRNKEYEYITEEVKSKVIEEQKEKYLHLVKEAGGYETNNETMFIWMNSFLTIHVFHYISLNEKDRTLIICSKNDIKDRIEIHNLIDKVGIEFNNSHDTKEQTSILLQMNEFPLQEDDIVYISSSIIINIDKLGYSLFNFEYKGLSKHFQKRPIELIEFNLIKLHADKYKMKEMLDDIKNKQFSAELGECLFAYENEKFYICASGIGGLIEHMIHLSIEKNGNSRSVKSNFTIDNYIGVLKQDPFNIDKRAQTYIRNIMSFRNSVSHFNSGFTSKEICDHLFDGLKNIYINYYLFEPLSKS